ncbi:MAG TPA: glutathione S-transferase family protein [Steroidobacteraceae bacterium]|jgi:glutathione S-transferase|nr:glutathione S-transferase family protein [Steroidobacteraceae bacterium]
MITLFHAPKTRSSRMIFLLEELQVPYEIRRVTIRRRDGSGGIDPANPHPHGKVPAISDDGTVVYESPAIALYLTDQYPTNHLGPLVGEPERGSYLTWLSYYSGVCEPAFVSKFMNYTVPRGTAGWVAVDEVLPVILETLAHQPYLLGERFSAVDVLYGTTFALFAQSPLLPKLPPIEQYVQRVLARPGYARARARDEDS